MINFPASMNGCVIQMLSQHTKVCGKHLYHLRITTPALALIVSCGACFEKMEMVSLSSTQTTELSKHSASSRERADIAKIVARVIDTSNEAIAELEHGHEIDHKRALMSATMAHHLTANVMCDADQLSEFLDILVTFVCTENRSTVLRDLRDQWQSNVALYKKTESVTA